MDVKSLQNLVLTRLRDNLTDVREANIRTDNSKWILSRFPSESDVKNLDEFKKSNGYPLLLVQTPTLVKAVMYNNGGMKSKFSMNLHIQHYGSLAIHDSLIKNIFDDFKSALENNFYLSNNLYVDEISYSPDDEPIITSSKVFNSTLVITFEEDEE